MSKQPTKKIQLDKYRADIETLLNRIAPRKQRSVCCPPEEASRSLGQRICQSYISALQLALVRDTSTKSTEYDRYKHEWREIGLQIINCFCEDGVEDENLANDVNLRHDRRNATKVNSAVYWGFFTDLASFPTSTRHTTSVNSDQCQTLDVLVKWWFDFVLLIEHREKIPILEACIRGYVVSSWRYIHLYSINETGKNTSSNEVNEAILKLVQLHHKLKNSCSRSYLIRESLRVTMGHLQDNHLDESESPSSGPTHALAILSSFMAGTIISSPLSTPSQRDEANIFLQCLMMEFRSILRQRTKTTQSSAHILLLIDWLSRSFRLFLMSSLSRIDRDHLEAASCLGYDFILMILEFTSIALYQGVINTHETAVLGTVKYLVVVVIENMFPIYFGHEESSKQMFQLYPIVKELNAIIAVCNNKRTKTGQNHRMKIPAAQVISLAVTCLEAGDERGVDLLLESMNFVLEGYDEPDLYEISGTIYSLACVFGSSSRHEVHVESLLKMVSCIGDGKSQLHHSRSIQKESDGFPCLISGQSEAMLYGLSMLSRSIITPGNEEYAEPEFVAAIEYMATLFEAYPHLGRRSYSVLTALVNRMEHKPVATTQVFELLCSNMASDTSCAHAIWSLFSVFMEGNSTVNVKCLVLRLYPLLCKANERLYGRMIDSVADFISDESAELRVSTVMTICDLITSDLIRDVQDIIGWVQVFLADEESLVVSYALLCLHGLIVNGDLDYALVIKVLKKRLVDIDDIDAILQLDAIVIESLMKLLGDGANEVDVSDDENDEQMSPQVYSSIVTLIKISLSFNEDVKRSSVFDIHSQMAILSSIYRALVGYPFLLLGVDEESVRSFRANDSSELTEDQLRFSDLIKIACEGMKCLSILADRDDEITNIFRHELQIYISKIIGYEEECLGPSQWKKSGRNQMLPEASDGTLTAIIVERIKDSFSPSDSADSDTRSTIGPLITSLQMISLPASFAKFLDTRIRNQDSNLEALQVICIETIMKQASITRRAVTDRKEMLSIASIWLNSPELSPPVSFSLVNHYPAMFSTMMSTSVGDAFDSLWRICCDQTSTSDIKRCMSVFLQGVSNLLRANSSAETKKQNRVSPSVISGIRQRLMTIVFSSICSINVSKEAGNEDMDIWTDYLECLITIPMNILHENEFFSFHSDDRRENILRTHVIACFQNHKKFGSKGFGLVLKAQCWIARLGITIGFTNNEEDSLFCSGALKLCQSVIEANPTEKVEFLKALLDILLVSGINQSCIAIIAMQVSVWCIGTKEKMKVMAMIEKSVQHTESQPIHHSFPRQFGALSQELGISELVTNRIMNVLRDHRMESNSIVDCLKDIIVCCAPCDNYENHASFITTLLIE